MMRTITRNAIPDLAWARSRDSYDSGSSVRKPARNSVAGSSSCIAVLGQAVTWDGRRDLLGFGVATALVMAPLSFHLRHMPTALGRRREDKRSKLIIDESR